MGAYDDWINALLVVSSWNLELLVQQHNPGLQERLALWSMPLRADVQQQQSLQYQQDAEPGMTRLFQQVTTPAAPCSAGQVRSSCQWGWPAVAVMDDQ